MGGIGRRDSIKGSSHRSTALRPPIKIPRETPRRKAMQKPQNTRFMLMNKAFERVPLRPSSISPFNAPTGVGVIFPGVPQAMANCQMKRKRRRSQLLFNRS
jgi:hypothetical protein